MDHTLLRWHHCPSLPYPSHPPPLSLLSQGRTYFLWTIPSSVGITAPHTVMQYQSHLQLLQWQNRFSNTGWIPVADAAEVALSLCFTDHTPHTLSPTSTHTLSSQRTYILTSTVTCPIFNTRYNPVSPPPPSPFSPLLPSLPFTLPPPSHPLPPSPLSRLPPLPSLPHLPSQVAFVSSSLTFERPYAGQSTPATLKLLTANDLNQGVCCYLSLPRPCLQQPSHALSLNTPPPPCPSHTHPAYTFTPFLRT